MGMGKRSSGPVLRSLSPRGRFPSYNSAGHLSSSSSSSTFASSTSSSFYSPSSAFFLPTQIRLSDALQSISPESFVADVPILDRQIHIFQSQHIRHEAHQSHLQPPARKTCMCSPTSHPRSFCCSLHKNSHQNGHTGGSSFIGEAVIGFP
ncbi:unnamed protein product [Linum trigynum]|uniref:Uncharacterized protein n=1 Tax=Linum trigynum TaxID=586398 RepID=A0AAV2CZV4_9ROSI